MHNDEEPGNAWGHHSFAMEFQKVDEGQPPEPEPEPEQPDDLAERVAILERHMIRFEQTLNAWAEALIGDL